LIAAAALCLAAVGAAATDAPSQCTTSGGGWTITASDPFEPASCPVDRCTGITYNIIKHNGLTPDHVALLVEHDAQIVIPSSTFITQPCAGDTVTALGSRDCSSQTARINQNQQKTGPFDLVVEDVLQPVGASIVVKKGKVVEQCRIASLGAPFEVFDPHQQVTTEQTFDFKGCKLKVAVDPVTGTPGDGTLEGEDCAFVANNVPVQAMSVNIDGVELGQGTFITDGHFSNGSESCTTRTISGRLYSYCDCRSLTDPKPPCR
jgi:hypothetical protein